MLLALLKATYLNRVQLGIFVSALFLKLLLTHIYKRTTGTAPPNIGRTKIL